MRDRNIARALLMLSVAACAAACSDSPTNPSPGVVVDPTRVPPASTEPVVSWTEIDGPEVVPVGQTVPFTLRARMSDGTFRDVTSSADWSAWPDHVSVAGPGIVGGRTSGDAELTAQFQGNRATRQLIVVPAGTYRLIGRVTEEGFPDGGVVGVTVAVTSGTGAGQLTAVTDLFGSYRLYGLAGPTTLRMMKSGYEPVDQDLVVEGHAQFESRMRLLTPRADVAGTYTIAITAAPACGVGLGSGALPDDARRRTYRAIVEQNGPTLSVKVSGEGLIDGPSEFGGWVEPHRIVFDLNWNGWQPHPIRERLAPSRWFLVDGVGVVLRSAEGLSGTFGGQLMVTESSESAAAIASCTSADHGFVLTR
jgi:hypothetical protein